MSMYRYDFMVVVFLKIVNDVKNVSVLKQIIGLLDIIVDGVDFICEGFILFDFGMEFFGKNIFVIGF